MNNNYVLASTVDVSCTAIDTVTDNLMAHLSRTVRQNATENRTDLHNRG